MSLIDRIEKRPINIDSPRTGVYLSVKEADDLNIYIRQLEAEHEAVAEVVFRAQDDSDFPIIEDLIFAHRAVVKP